MQSFNYVHRDIKASNVLLDECGNAVLADFGSCKKLRAGERAMSFVGTLHAMAPEVIARRGHGKGVDWWALGILLYEMITGKAPFGYGIGLDRKRAEREIAARIEKGVKYDDDDDDDDDGDGDDGGGGGGGATVGRSAKDLIGRLLEIEEGQRLVGFEAFSRHNFLEPLLWRRVGEGGIIQVEGACPKFDKSIGDLDVLDAKSGAECDEVKEFDARKFDNF